MRKEERELMVSSEMKEEVWEPREVEALELMKEEVWEEKAWEDVGKAVYDPALANGGDHVDGDDNHLRCFHPIPNNIEVDNTMVCHNSSNMDHVLNNSNMARLLLHRLLAPGLALALDMKKVERRWGIQRG